MKDTNSKIKPVDGHKDPEMKNTTTQGIRRKLKRFTGLVGATLLLLAYAPACKTIYIPVETGTTVHVKDSTVWNIKDSIRITEATHYRDMAWLGDSLKIEGQRSRMWAVADTAKGALVGGLEEDKIEEKTRIIYKDRLVYKDSLVYVEKPVPVEIIKEKKVYPRWLVLLSTIGILLTCLEGFRIYIRLKKKLPLG